LIDSILNDLKFRDEVKPKDMPAPSTIILNKDEDGDNFDESFHYRGVIGKLNFLEKSTRPGSTRHCLRCSSSGAIFC
jgi:hypothetical protein